MIESIIKKNFRITGKITMKAIDEVRYIVYIDGKYFGIYDLNRKTFVD